ncbi:hypothetical protein O6H91_Y158300 [Diphasiastrum complanatum]|nr:hypothetical protein O6H91_Y158300 [Diphasiastrum complanatum]
MGSLIHQCSLSMHNPTSKSLLEPASGKFRTWALHRAHRSIEGASIKGARAFPKRSSSKTVVCGLGDFVGGDLLKFDLGKWSEDVEKYGSVAIYPPAEGGYEGRYATRLKAEGYHFLNLTAKGLGDLEACLTKVHGVRPPHLGKQAVAVYYFPPEVDYRLSLLPKDSKGLVLWLIEAQVLDSLRVALLQTTSSLSSINFNRCNCY